MLQFPLAKINIGLHVLGKRADGYHNLETVFYPVKLCDVLEILPSSDLEMHVWEGEGMKENSILKENSMENLCVQAFKLLRANFEIAPVAIHLLKKIPVGAGLGGGSSDAAAMLTMLNAYFGLGLSADRLRAYALSLGSDCPFFIESRPAFATGRGEVLTPLELDLSAYFLVLIKPSFSISTKEAFSAIRVRKPIQPLSEVIKGVPETWKSLCINDFEQSLFPLYPLLSVIKESLYERGAIFASLSGSGSALYGIFEYEPASADFEKFGEVFVRKL